MAARATASGTISFGLVSIPIKVYTAAQSKSVSFNMLHEKDKGRLKQKYVCSVCEDEVPRGETVRGYEYSRGQYVVLTAEELEAFERKSDRSIEITEFIPIEKVDPVFFEKSNMLGPDKGGSKAYALLRQAMYDSGRVALGRFNARGKQQLVLLRPTARGLMLHGLYYADEVRSFDDVEMGDVDSPRDSELELAHQLIGQLSRETFEPERYEDEWRRDVLDAIDRKVAGEEIHIPVESESSEKIIDLVAALKASLAAKGEGADDKKPAKRKAAAKKSARRKTGS